MHREITKLHDPNGIFMRTLAIKEKRIKLILHSAKKPIFIIRGNHDQTHWQSESNIHNIHWTKLNFNRFNFIGYQHSEFSRTQEQQRKDFEHLKTFIDNRTVLVSHIPAFGILDRTGHDPSWSLGSKALRDLLGHNKPLVHIHGHVHQASGHKDASFNASFPVKRQFLCLDLDNLHRLEWIDPKVKPKPRLYRHESGQVSVHGPFWYDMPTVVIEKYIRMAEKEELENRLKVYMEQRDDH